MTRNPRTRGRRVVTVGSVVAALVLGLISVNLSVAPPVSASPEGPRTYTNPVTPPAADAFGSPSVIRGRDGYWYAFGPGNPLHAGDPRPLYPILRSPDLVSWEYMGDVFTEENYPAWALPNSGRWAPSIEYFDGLYHFYFTIRDIRGYQRDPNVETAIGVATAPTPLGPWTDSGQPLVPPSKWTPANRDRSQYRTTIDADVLTAPDGNRYLYYGGFGGGLFVTQLTDDGMETVGEPKQIATHSTFEGPYVVRRDGWYYLFTSSNHCCKGPVTAYTVFVARSKSPTGPFVDRLGQPLTGPNPGGTPVIAPNGNKWVGTGHNAAVRDLAGQDWITVNGIDRADPYLSGDRGEIKRPLLIDRLDWIDGWPTVNAGRWASEAQMPAPIAQGLIDDQFEDGAPALGRTWRATDGWSIGREPAGGFAEAAPGASERVLTARTAVTGGVKVRLAVRAGDGHAGFEIGRRQGDVAPVRVVVDGQELVVSTRGAKGRADLTRVRLPDSYVTDSYHELQVNVTRENVNVRLSDAGLFDPIAVVEVPIGAVPALGPFSVVASGGASVDDVTVAELYSAVTEKVAAPQVGAVLDADEFDGSLDERWTWVRGPAGEVQGGRFTMPVLDTDLSGQSDDAALLLRDVDQDSSWIAETKLTLPFGDGPFDAFPQAGLIAYNHDDDYLRLTVRAHRDVKISEFQKEMPWFGDTRSAHGRAGAVRDTTYLRLQHTVDPVNGEHEFRSATSIDGENWVWSMTYTLPADADVRMGFVALGAGRQSGQFEASFEYFRIYATRARSGHR